VVVTRHLGPANGGGSGAQVFSDEDGIKFVVKFKENPQGLRVLANELVSNKLGLYLEVPMPEGCVVDIPQEVINLTPAIGSARPTCPVTTGPHFGVRRLSDYWKTPPPGELSKIKNMDSVPGIFVFDLLTLNSDRKPEHLLLAKGDFDHAGRYVSAIDHGHCFGAPAWDVNIAQNVDRDNLQVIPGLMECVVGATPFQTFIDRLRSLDRTTIDTIINQIPADWGLSTAEMTALANFLEARKNRVEAILLNHRAQFPKWN